MQSAEALATALGMLNCPQLARRARQSPLPKGVTFLLEVAAGESDALLHASTLTGRSEANLRKAAGFFIEQVLVNEQADNYRVLGGSRNSPHTDLRRNMALLMRWLHPDIVSGGSSALFDKGLYADRVTGAWEAIKTKERRAAYDAALAASKIKPERGPNRGSRPLLIPRLPRASARSERKTQRALVPRKRHGFWNRVRLLFVGHP